MSRSCQAAIFNCDLRDCLPLELLKVEAALFEAAPDDLLASGLSRRLLARWRQRFKVNVSHGFEGLKNGAAYARLPPSRGRPQRAKRSTRDVEPLPRGHPFPRASSA